MRALRHRNMQLKQKVWDQYHAYSEELNAMKRQNRALEQSLKVEQSKNAEMFEKFAKKIREMERKVNDLRKTSPFVEVPAPNAKEIRGQTTSFLFMELEEEGKMLDARTDEVFKKCHEPVISEYAWRTPPPIDYENEYRPEFLVTPELAGRKVIGYQEELSESLSLSSEEEDDQENTLVQAPKVKIQTNTTIQKPLYTSEIPSVLPEPQVNYNNPSTQDYFTSESEKVSPRIVQPEPTLQEPVRPKSISTPSYSSQTVPESVFSPAKDEPAPRPEPEPLSNPRPVIQEQPKPISQPLQKEEPGAEEIFGMGNWGSDSDSDERPEIDSDVMKELNLNGGNETDIQTTSINPSETMPLRAASTTMPLGLEQKQSESESELDIPDVGPVSVDPPKEEPPKKEPSPAPSPPKGIQVQESSSKLDDMEIEFNEFGDVDLGDDMW